MTLTSLNKISFIVFIIGCVLSAGLENNFQWYTWVIMLITLLFGGVSIYTQALIEEKKENE